MRHSTALLQPALVVGQPTVMNMDNGSKPTTIEIIRKEKSRGFCAKCAMPALRARMVPLFAKEARLYAKQYKLSKAEQELYFQEMLKDAGIEL